MSDTLQYLVRHGYIVLFASVLAQQLGVPLPSTPFIVAAGALAHTGQLSFGAALFVAFSAAMIADLVWFEIGRLRGTRVLATPMAGVYGLARSRFLLFDGLGILLWIGTFELLGYLFSDQLEDVVAYASRFGGLLTVLFVGGLAAYVGWKYAQRRRFLRSLRVARITPEQLKAELDSGADLVIVDLRHALEDEAEPRTLPGAMRLPAEKLEERGGELPHGKTLVLYCS